ncbi:MAG: hypothetical protein N2257_04610 [Thermodesulfovibrionales bacterium]|nr:hypothetical protein [Thermodesulfovibrionales bacterium]
MKILVPLFLVLLIPVIVHGAGKHELLNCTGCHAIHTAKGDIIFAVEPNKKALNPQTKTPYTGVTALCLGCHETPERGGAGIAPISGAMSHPFSVTPNPKVATVPQGLLRDGKLECSGCHDPHPSNPNYKYLRVDTKAGKEMETFCAVCHPSKVEKAPKDVKIFDSMDERRLAEKLAPQPAPAPAPKKTQ